MTNSMTVCLALALSLAACLSDDGPDMPPSQADAGAAPDGRVKPQPPGPSPELAAARLVCAEHCDVILAADRCETTGPLERQAQACRDLCAGQLDGADECADEATVYWQCLGAVQWTCATAIGPAEPTPWACPLETDALRACILNLGEVQ